MQTHPAAIRDRPIRIAVVGCGRIAANHFKAIEAHRNELRLVAVCDNDPQALEAAQRRHDVPGYGSIVELLKSEVDVVALCTPSGLHPLHAVLALFFEGPATTEK